MSKRRRMRGGRFAVFFVLCAIFGIALVVFPTRTHRSAFAAAEGGAPAPAKPKKPKPPADAGAADAGEPKPTGAEAIHAADAGQSTSGGGGNHPPPKDDKDKKNEKDGDLPTIPLGKGLPIEVNVAVFFLEVKSFEDAKGEFEATTDVRLQWSDLRLHYPPEEAFRGYKEYRGKEAEAQLAKIWTPNLEVVNKIANDNAPPTVGRRLRLYPHGDVELINRVTQKYKTEVKAETFPFDRQHLRVELLMREQTTDEVILHFDKEDVEFSRASKEASVDGWDLGIVELKGRKVPGWNGDRYSGVTAGLLVERVASTGLAPIFIPLVASLLIPLLALWMNKATEEGYEIEAFELANMGIGGLFSVIALSFAIYTSFPIIAGSDNTVTRLFGLNYATLALSLGIVVVFFRFNAPLKLFGPYVNEELFRFLCWALPLLTMVTGLAFMLVAAS